MGDAPPPESNPAPRNIRQQLETLGLIEEGSSVWVGRCAEKDAVIVVGAVTQESKPAGRRASGTPLPGQEAMLWLVIPWGWHSAFSPTPPISCREEIPASFTCLSSKRISMERCSLQGSL